MRYVEPVICDNPVEATAAVDFAQRCLKEARGNRPDLFPISTTITGLNTTLDSWNKVSILCIELSTKDILQVDIIPTLRTIQ